MIMGRLSDTLTEMIKKQVTDRGIVVWYDPQKAYAGLTRRLELPGTTVLFYENGFFRLRQQLEPLLECVTEDEKLRPEADQPPAVLLYIPIARGECGHALIEAETAGTFIEPGAARPECNTRLGLLAERVFAEIAPAKATHLARQADDGLLSIDELDRMAEDAGARTTGALQIIFGHASAEEIILQFIATGSLDTAIAEKNALQDLTAFLLDEIGFKVDELVKSSTSMSFRAQREICEAQREICEAQREICEVQRKICGAQNDTEIGFLPTVEMTDSLSTTFYEAAKVDEAKNAADLRTGLRRYALMAELLLEIPADNIPEALRRLPVPEKPVQRDLVRHVCAVWRNRLDLKDFYVEAAESVEKTVALHAISLPLEALEASETFPTIERRWLLHAAKTLAGGQAQEALRIAGVRMPRFWAKELAALQLEWRVLEAAATVCLEAARVRSELKTRKWTLQELVKAYAGHAEPWMRLDRWARHLDSRYARLEALDSGAESLEKAVIMARQQYADTLNALCSAYAVTAAAAEFAAGYLARQTDVFNTAVRPLLSGKIKAAYFLFDALRYEMAAELLEGMGDDYKGTVEPVIGQLPGITQVGMAALLPGAEQGLSLEKKGAGLSVGLSGHLLATRQDRIAWIREWAEVPTAVYRLGEVVKLSPKRKKEIEAANLIVVTAQEIDRLGEEGPDEEEYRVYMDEVLEKARRAIRSLARVGVQEFVMSTDHGFQLVAAMDPGLSMDPPGGETLELHPRVWIGQGGGKGEGFLRFKASDLELGGPMEFAFPRGLGAFKVKGGVGAYFHGGISPQEHVLPLVRMKVPKAGAGAKADVRVKLSMSKSKITNRIFTLTIETEGVGLFPGTARRVRLEMIAGKTVAGQAVVAGYGFEESTREVTVAAGKPNVVTLMLGPGEAPAAVTIQVWDCESQIVLDSIKDIPVELSM
jgi:hypothetical protein